MAVFIPPLMAIGLLFSGQGTQQVGMGRSLYENSATARALYDEADAVLGWNLSKICFEGPAESLTETKVCQPALYVHGYVIYKLLEESGKLDDLKVCLGLSLGELTALAAAGAFDFATGLKIVAERGRLMQEACDSTEGSMASIIGGSPDAVRALVEAHDIDVANLNCPGQIVISGASDKVATAVEAANAAGDFKRVIPLTVAGAYHSRLMESARARFADYLAKADISAPTKTVFTNVTAAPVTTPAEIRENLTKQVVSSVRWEECMQAAAASGITEFYECGPGAVLSGLTRRIDRSLKITSLSEFEHLPLD
jgi:[acyl-carrier-protein] S-malonyltransferase|tara:strand:- start:1862 stop:2797 length:936 start_codon:yes stop_codon:yes gene_type:complete